MKRIGLLLILALNFLAFPAWAEGEIILDRLTKEQAEELNIVIPRSTPPGFHSITIEVYDDNGVIKDKEIPFCKSLRGKINWDNLCPDVVALASFDQLMKIKVREDLPPYSPAQEPDKTRDLQIGALAALAALASSRRKEESNDQDSSGGEGESQQEELASVDSGKLSRISRDPGWGDRSATWKMPLTEWSDRNFVRISDYVQNFSPLLARGLVDGSYLRAIFGGYALILLPIGFLLGLKALIDTRTQALAPVLITLLLIVGVAILDACAGLIAATVFLTGTLIGGNVFSRSELLTVLGVTAIFFAPSLLASAVRPLRRLISDSDGLWERITDYLLAITLTAWLVEKMINALNGLSGIQLAITYQARTIAIASALLVAVRLIGEDVATYLYPIRLDKTTPDLPEPTIRQQFISGAIKTFLFLLLATPYVGVNIQLVMAGIIFILPLMASLTFAEKLPKTVYLGRFNPQGTLKLVILTFLGALVGGILEEKFSDPTEFLKWCFVIVAIPGLIFAIIEWFAQPPTGSWRTLNSGRLAYRVIGFLVFLLVIQIVRGADLTAWLIK